MMERSRGRLAAFHARRSDRAGGRRARRPRARCARAGTRTSRAPRRSPARSSRAEDHEILADFGPAFIRAHETLLRARQHAAAASARVTATSTPSTSASSTRPSRPRATAAAGAGHLRLRLHRVLAAVPLQRRRVRDRLPGDGPRQPRAPGPRPALRGGLRRRRGRSGRAVCCCPSTPATCACVRGMVEGLESAEAEVEPADREAAAARGAASFRARRALRLDGGWAGRDRLHGAQRHRQDDARRRAAADDGLRAVSAPTRSASSARARARGAGPRGVRCGPLHGRGPRGDLRGARAPRPTQPSRQVGASSPTPPSSAAPTATGSRGGAPSAAAVRLRRAAGPTSRWSAPGWRPREEGRSVSDARWETYVAQRERCEPFGADEPHLVVDTGGDPATARAAALRALWRWRRERAMPVSAQRAHWPPSISIGPG